MAASASAAESSTTEATATEAATTEAASTEAASAEAPESVKAAIESAKAEITGVEAVAVERVTVVRVTASVGVEVWVAVVAVSVRHSDSNAHRHTCVRLRRCRQNKSNHHSEQGEQNTLFHKIPQTFLTHITGAGQKASLPALFDNGVIATCPQSSRILGVCAQRRIDDVFWREIRSGLQLGEADRGRAHRPRWRR